MSLKSIVAQTELFFFIQCTMQNVSCQDVIIFLYYNVMNQQQSEKAFVLPTMLLQYRHLWVESLICKSVFFKENDNKEK